MFHSFLVREIVASIDATPYRRRRPERTLRYRTVQTHFATWLALRHGECDDADAVPGYVERDFRRYLECSILAHGFARARCAQCGHDFLIALSCKGRGVCPASNARRMVATAAHLTDHVLPNLPLRQGVLAVPKRLRYFLELFGLSSGICTNRMDDATRLAKELQVGTVNLWEVPGYSIELTPFGGIKDSGWGYKEGVQEAIKSFTNGKTFTMPR